MIRFVTIAAVLLISTTLAFYWYEFRPMQIREDCSKIAKDIRFAKGREMKADKNIKTALILDDYTFCLHSKGI